MAPKRAGESPVKRGRAKRSRTVNLVPVVVNAIENAQALPADLRTALTVALPIVLNANKVDRHAYETEVVNQAEKALATVQAALEAEHAEALKKQNEVIAPAEHAKRTGEKKTAEANAQSFQAKLEANKETQVGARRNLHDAQSAWKAAMKDATAAEKEMQAHADKKTNLSELLANEFVLLKDGTSATPAGKEAVKKLSKLGKEYKFDDTLLQTFPLTCKKEPANRTDFEVMMFSSLKAAIDRLIDENTSKLAEMEPGKAEKLSAVASAKDAVDKAEAALAASSEELSATVAGSKAADKEVSKADAHLYKIWGDMKVVCDAQDELAHELKNLKEHVCTAFQQLKEKEPEPEAPEPEAVEEEPVEEETTAPVEAAAPVEAETAAPVDAAAAAM